MKRNFSTQWLILTVVCLGLSASPLFAADAQGNYKQHCAKCHGDSGKGDGATAKKFEMKMTNYSDKAAMAKITDEYMTEMVTKGGKALKKSPKMQAYAGKLSEAEIKDLVAYIRTFSK